jgi:hypothetical protein
MKQKLILVLFISLFPVWIFSQVYKVIESTSTFIKVSFDFSGKYRLKDTLIDGKSFTYILGEEYSIRKPGEPWLPTVYLNVGIPYNSKPTVKILKVEQENFPQRFIISYPDSSNQKISSLKFDEIIYNNNTFYPKSAAEITSEFTMRFAHAAGFSVYPYQFNPISRDLIFNKKIIVQIDFNTSPRIGISVEKVNDNLTDDFIETTVVNSHEAKEFTGKIRDYLGKASQDTVWYNPQKSYFKIFIKEKGFYKVTYEQLLLAGVPENEGLHEGNLELISNGQRIPMDIIDDDKDGSFNAGDYFYFIGSPPKSTNPYTYSNIYTLENVYWFSYQADSVYKYKIIDGYPTKIDTIIYTVLETTHYEEDKVYEPLGLAPDDKRDFWFWDRADILNSIETHNFRYDFNSFAPNINPDFPQGSVRANLQGMTLGGCYPTHSAYVKFNGVKIGTIEWNNQNSVTFSKDIIYSFYSYHPDSVRWLQNGNYFEIGLDGDICTTIKTDQIRINWFEFDHWRWNRISGSYYNFKSPPNNYGENLYYMWQWKSNDMRVYIPERGQAIINPWVKNDVDQSVLFVDTLYERTEYFCVSKESFLVPDSIVQDAKSDLRNTSNATDYIIITHSKFEGVAQTLAQFRSNNLPGITDPRVKVVDVQDIYDEFSFGLLDPLALKMFVKYAFDNWKHPALTYVALLGDMSYDYRGIYVSSRPNFIPSITVQTPELGQTPSDNETVCVSGNDIVPDLALGRISCETIEEGNILVDKIMNYPADNSKKWKENVSLIASGLSSPDELKFGFNDESLYLDNEYLIPNGFTSAKVFRYPNKPSHFPFQGEGPEIREEINNGAVMVNYYGHGGGEQWDLVFTYDDIYKLENADKLPMVISVTCYTAHFDNQDSFGEQFNKVLGKGSVSFYGSAGLTWWQAGTYINKQLFNEIFNRRNLIFGLAALKANQSVPVSSFIASQISALTLLGDPALELAFPKYPDFEIKSADISIEPINPLKDDTVKIFLKYRNIGVIFPDDSVTIQIFKDFISHETLIGEIKRGSFGQSDSLELNWIPGNAGLTTLIARINESDTLWEIDHSDNTASFDVAIYSFGQPNIVRPINGHYQNSSQVDFIFTDIGTSYGRNFSYLIEVDTTKTLNSSFKITSPILNQVDGIVKWKTPELSMGEYFWRATIYDATDTNSSFINTFSITDFDGSGYYSQNNQLKNFQTQNMFYSESSKSLVLNTDTLPPYPSSKKLLDTINISLPNEARGITTFTTDGSYFYYGHLSFYTFGGSTKIYKVGTGLNGTIRGFNYGTIPNLQLNVNNQIFAHSDGFIYVTTGDDSSLLRLNPNTGDTIRIMLQEKMLPTEDGLLRNGGYYIISDGNLVYNLSAGYGDRREKYTIRIFDPKQGWQKVGNDIYFDGTSFRGFSGFIVVNGYLIVYESYESGYMRRFRLADGFFEEQWLSFDSWKGFYTMSYDWVNNFVYVSTFLPVGLYKPGFYKFVGTYQDAVGSATSEAIGPSVKWKNSTYDIDATGSTGIFNVYLLGKNKSTSIWDTLSHGLPSNYSLENVDVNVYDYLKFHFQFVDSSYNPSAPSKLNSLLVNYDSSPEIAISSKDLTFSADTILQGFPVEMYLNIKNIGYSTAQNLNIKFYLNDADSAFISDNINLDPDSSTIIHHTISTSNLIFDSKFKVVSTASVPEFYTFNNITENSFFVARDSINPYFSVTVDGKEIVNGDVVSAKPEILITLSDNSPLPLDTTLFTIIFDNIPLTFQRPDLEYTYTPYPNSEANIRWTPNLLDGRHTLEVLAKDASGNFFDTTSSRSVFYVYNQADLLNVFNYPNPFKNDTYFTFELRGTEKPEEFLIKIYTVAGRLIKDISVPSSDIEIGFNKVYWDGRDEDGDEISNGVYFYKIISRLKDETKVITEKLAKVK